MKIKTIIICIALFVSAFIMLVSYENQKVEWKGKIEKENGIKVMKNSTEPLYGEIKFELEENLSISNQKEVITYTEPPSQASHILLERVIFTLAL